MEKKRVLLSYGKISPNTEREIAKQFPFGFENQFIDMKTADGKGYKALLIETDDLIYLIKFNENEVRRLKIRWASEPDFGEDTMLDLEDDFEGMSEEYYD